MLETKMTELLDQLAGKLGVASSKIWEWAMLQVKVDLVVNSLTVILVVIFTTIYVKCLIKALNNWQEIYNNDKENLYGTILTVIGCCLLVLDVVALCMAISIPSLLINPEYAAFKNIVEQLDVLK